MPPHAPTFAERYALWQSLHVQHGPGRAYPYAWRLPEMARPLGQASLQQAQYALALDLYTLGRFTEASAALPCDDARPSACALRQAIQCALANSAETHDSPETAYPLIFPGDSSEISWPMLQHVLHDFRQGQRPDLGTAYRVLAQLRVAHPTLAAQAEALLAEVHFWRSPRWSVVWLDHALDQLEQYSQRHLAPRLLHLKAHALSAAGELREAERFAKLANALAQRQGALRYVDFQPHEPIHATS